MNKPLYLLKAFRNVLKYANNDISFIKSNRIVSKIFNEVKLDLKEDGLVYDNQEKLGSINDEHVQKIISERLNQNPYIENIFIEIYGPWFEQMFEKARIKPFKQMVRDQIIHRDDDVIIGGKTYKVDDVTDDVLLDIDPSELAEISRQKYLFFNNPKAVARATKLLSLALGFPITASLLIALLTSASQDDASCFAIWKPDRNIKHKLDYVTKEDCVCNSNNCAYCGTINNSDVLGKKFEKCQDLYNVCSCYKSNDDKNQDWSIEYIKDNAPIDQITDVLISSGTYSNNSSSAYSTKTIIIISVISVLLVILIIYWIRKLIK